MRARAGVACSRPSSRVTASPPPSRRSKGRRVTSGAQRGQARRSGCSIPLGTVEDPRDGGCGQAGIPHGLHPFHHRHATLELQPRNKSHPRSSGSHGERHAAVPRHSLSTSNPRTASEAKLLGDVLGRRRTLRWAVGSRLLFGVQTERCRHPGAHEARAPRGGPGIPGDLERHVDARHRAASTRRKWPFAPRPVRESGAALS